jgi:hypothetical protein
VRTRIWASGALLAIVLLASCASAGHPDYGPLATGLNGGGIGTECVPVRPGGVVSYGLEVLINHGTAVTVTKVGLAHSRGLQVVQAWIVPVTGHTLYGVLDGYPPAAHIPGGVHWDQRQRAVGAIIPHTDGHRVANLLLVLKPRKKVASAAGVSVAYRESDKSYHLKTHIGIVLMTAKPCS